MPTYTRILKYTGPEAWLEDCRKRRIVKGFVFIGPDKQIVEEESINWFRAIVLNLLLRLL